MKITIVGTGNAGTGVAAHLAQWGHEVTMLKTSQAGNREHFAFLQMHRTIRMLEGDSEVHAALHKVTTDCREAIEAAELVILFVQTNYHRDILRRLAPFFHDGQTLLIEPGYLSTCYVLQSVPQDITVIEAESSPLDCRITEPGTVQILFRNVRNPFGVYPLCRRAAAERVLESLHIPFCLTKNVVEAALHNPNMIVHTVGAFMSIPRIEYTHGDYWMYREVFTPHVWTMVEALDREKMDILEKLGCARLAYVDACKQRNSLELSRDGREIFFDYAQHSSPQGPRVPDSRYLTEDVSQGLVLLESLGALLGVKTPVGSSLIELSSCALSRDFRAEGRTIESLGEAGLKKILSDRA